MEDSQQMPHGFGIAGQVNAIGTLALCRDCMRQRLILFEADQRNRATIAQKACAEPTVILEWPSAYRQDTAARVNQHQFFALKCGEIGMQLCGGLLQLIIRESQPSFTPAETLKW